MVTAKAGPLGPHEFTLQFHASETLDSGVDRKMGFLLARDENGAPIYSVVDDAPRDLVAQVQAAGYNIDPETLGITFLKTAWDGPFGAYEERPGQNRPAHGENIDFKCQNPRLAYKRFTMGYKVRTASDGMTFNVAAGTIVDAASLLAEFKTGDTIDVTNSPQNNGTYLIATGGVAGTITVDGTTPLAANEGPVAATLTVNNGNVAIADVKVFSASTYVITADRFVYKVTGWSNPGDAYLVSVRKHSETDAVGTRLHVHNGYIYAAFGPNAAYAYSADGTTWTESNRGGTDATADEFITLRGVLHKRVGSNHYQLTAATDNGINGGTAWSSADQIGDTSFGPSKMLVLQDNILFPTTTNLLNLDSGGNINDLLPGLVDSSGYAWAEGAQAWLNSYVFVPMRNGTSILYHGGEAIPATPTDQLERPLPVTITPTLTQDIRYTAMVGKFLYALQTGSTIRVLELEQVGPAQFIWRTLLLQSSSPLLTALWASFSSATGHILWVASDAAGTRLNYWVPPVGRDATLLSTVRYVSSGILYDPWMSLGCPEVQKRWSHIEIGVTQSTPANYAKTTYTLDAYNEAGSDVITTNTVAMAEGITIATVNFNANTVSRRCRLMHTLGNTGTGQDQETPILLWTRVHAFARPTRKARLKAALRVPAAGVGGGVASQEKARAFLKNLRTAKLPVTAVDCYGETYTVNPAISQIPEVVTGKTGVRADAIWQVTLIEQPAGV